MLGVQNSFKADEGKTESMEDVGDWLRTLDIRREPTSQELMESLSRLIDMVKEYIKGDGEELYVTNEDEILFKVIRNGETPHETQEVGKLGPGTTIASYTGYTKKFLVVQAGTDMSNFPVGSSLSSTYPAQILCVPVISGNGDLLSVLEFTRDIEPLFSQAEINLAKCISAWVGRSVKKKPTDLIKKNRIYRLSLNDMRQFMQGTFSLENFISRTLKSLSDRTGADVVNLYRTDLGQTYQMYGQVKRGLFLKSREELELKDNEFIYDIYRHHVGIKIDKDADKMLFNPEFIDPKLHITDYPLRNYMCLPIGEPSKTLGILELMNTDKEDGFSEEDKLLAQDIGKTCCAGFYYKTALRENTRTVLAQQEALYEDQQYLMKKNIVCKNFIQDFFKRTPQIITPNNFYRFDFYNKNPKEVDSLTWLIFKDVFNLTDTHDEASLSAIYIIMSAKHFYKPNSFHNMEHAFNMCHCMYLIVRNNRHIFTEREVRALIIATLLHDIDHPGFGNQFISYSKNPLCQLYGFSYLEHHHVHIAKQVVEKSKLFSYLNEREYKSTLKLIEKSILDTDLATYFVKRQAITELLVSKTFDVNNRQHRNILISITMTSADLSGQCKPFEIAALLCRKLIKEQQREALLCDRLGLSFSTGILHDEESFNTPHFQIQFNEEISLPCFDLLRRILTNVAPIYLGCLNNTKIWKKVSRGEIFWDTVNKIFIEQENK